MFISNCPYCNKKLYYSKAFEEYNCLNLSNGPHEFSINYLPSIINNIKIKYYKNDILIHVRWNFHKFYNFFFEPDFSNFKKSLEKIERFMIFS
jgi:hypothetical protein